MKSKVLNRFLEYVSYDTQSDETTGKTPSTERQLLLGRRLAEELKEIGMTSVSFDSFGYVYGILEATKGREEDISMGLIAHMDTSPDASGENICPKIIENYDGKDIVLNKENNIRMSPQQFSDLKKYIGQSLVVTDGTTLLGADDKAGIAEIMTALEECIKEQIPHGKICVAFTPDEEIGEGTDHFDKRQFPAEYAYTVDGGEIGELEYECFNAASAVVTLHGINIHPGEAKDKMRNALHLAMEYHGMLPPLETPFHTQDDQGFFHLTTMEGNVETAQLHYIVRDHHRSLFEKRKLLLEQIAEELNEKYGEKVAVPLVKDSYYNMKEVIDRHPQVIAKAKTAMEANSVLPLVRRIRGGTDGARLSFMGIPTPNLSAGGHHFHGRFEFVPVESMEKMVDVLKSLIEGD